MLGVPSGVETVLVHLSPRKVRVVHGQLTAIRQGTFLLSPRKPPVALVFSPACSTLDAVSLDVCGCHDLVRGGAIERGRRSGRVRAGGGLHVFGLCRFHRDASFGVQGYSLW